MTPAELTDTAELVSDLAAALARIEAAADALTETEPAAA
jgi:hypothetical protein